MGAQAIDNNFLHVIGLGLIAGSTAYSAYNVYSAYNDGGAEAAIKQLGIEVVTEAAGIATGAVVGKVIGKIGYKFGPKIYQTVKGAVDAALEAQPGLKMALGKFGDKLVAGAEKVGASALGKAAKKADKLAKKVNDKIANGVTNRLNGLGEDLAAVHLPGPVAAKMEARAAQQAVVAEAQAVAQAQSVATEMENLRTAIVNHEIKVTDDLLPKFGFTGVRTESLGRTNKATGRFGVNTELDGNIDYAYELYYSKVKNFSHSRKLISEETKNLKNGAIMISSIFEDESLVQLRTCGKSGHPKIEITDAVKNIEEKITFK